MRNSQKLKLIIKESVIDALNEMPYREAPAVDRTLEKLPEIIPFKNRALAAIDDAARILIRYLNNFLNNRKGDEKSKNENLEKLKKLNYFKDEEIKELASEIINQFSNLDTKNKDNLYPVRTNLIKLLNSLQKHHNTTDAMLSIRSKLGQFGQEIRDIAGLTWRDFIRENKI